MALWEDFEDELEHYEIGEWFTSQSFADDWGITSREATVRIQRYLTAQHAKRPKTKYVLVRGGRTRGATWTIGQRAEDARNDLGQFASDTKHRVVHALHPDLDRIGKINPRAGNAVEQGLEPIVDGLVQMLTGVMLAVGWDGTE